MNRKLLIHTLALPFLTLAVASACSLEDGTPSPVTGGTNAGGAAGASSGGSAGTPAVGGSGVQAGSPGMGGMAGSVAMGGMAGSVAMGGMAGSAMGGMGGMMGMCMDPDCFAGTKNMHGFAWKDSYFLVACTEVQAHDCLTVQGACPNQGAANFEDKGSTFAEEFKMGGTMGTTYAVTLKVNGVVEGKYYTGGTRRAGADTGAINTGADGWHVGGAPIPSSYNVFKIGVFQPDGTTEVAHYYLNSFPQASGLESHQTVLIAYEATIDVPGMGVIKYLNQDSNCRAINNCGPGDNGPNCPAARNVPNEPGLAVPATYGSEPVNASFNVVNQAQQPFHAQMVHVTVSGVAAK